MSNILMCLVMGFMLIFGGVVALFAIALIVRSISIVKMLYKEVSRERKQVSERNQGR